MTSHFACILSILNFIPIFFQNPEVQLQHYCPDVTGNFHFRFINDNVITFFPVYVCCSCCACCFCRMHVCLGDTAYFVAYCFSFVQKLLKTQNSYTEFYLPPGGNNFGSLLITVLRLFTFSFRLQSIIGNLIASLTLYSTCDVRQFEPEGSSILSIYDKYLRLFDNTISFY